MFIFLGMAFVLLILKPHLFFWVIFFFPVCLAAVTRLPTVPNYLGNLGKKLNMNFCHQVEKGYPNDYFAVRSVACYVQMIIKQSENSKILVTYLNRAQ